MNEQHANQVVPKPRRRHFAAEEADKLKKEFAHLYNDTPPQPTPPAGNNIILNPPPVLPTDSQVDDKKTDTQPVEDNKITTTPVVNIPFPKDFEDLLGNVTNPSSDTTTKEPVASEDKSEEFRRKNEELLRELEETRKQLEEARKIPDNLRALHDEQELETLLKNSGVDFRTIDIEDAKKLIAPIIQTMRKQQSESNAEFQRKLSEQETALKDRFKELDDREHYNRLEKTKAAILAAHPDLEELQKTPAYRQMMASPIGGKSGVLIGQLVAAEYRQGNADYIIDVLNRVKAGVQNDITDITSVSPSSSSTPPSNVDDKKTGRLSPEELADLRFKVQSRQISRQEFREIMEKHREAQR